MLIRLDKSTNIPKLGEGGGDEVSKYEQRLRIPGFSAWDPICKYEPDLYREVTGDYDHWSQCEALWWRYKYGWLSRLALFVSLSLLFSFTITVMVRVLQPDRNSFANQED